MLLPKLSNLLIKFLSSRCEAFPTYPRTYDLVHGEGLLSLQFGEEQRCEMLDVFTEIDRMLRPEVCLLLLYSVCKTIVAINNERGADIDTPVLLIAVPLTFIIM